MSMVNLADDPSLILLGILLTIVYWYAIPLSEWYCRMVFSITSIRLSPDACQAYRAEVLYVLLESLWDDHKRGLDKCLIAFNSFIRASNVLLSALWLRRRYAAMVPTSSRATGWTGAGRPDTIALGAIVGLGVIGVLAMYSLSGGAELADLSTGAYQLGWLLGGVLLFAGLMALNYKYLYVTSPVFMMVVVIGLMVSISVQEAVEPTQITGDLLVLPRELAKVALIVYTSAWLSSRRLSAMSFVTGSAPFVVAVGVVLALLVMTNDLVGASITACAVGTLFVLSGGSLRIGIMVTVVAGSLLALTGMEPAIMSSSQLGDLLQPLTMLFALTAIILVLVIWARAIHISHSAADRQGHLLARGVGTLLMAQLVVPLTFGFAFPVESNVPLVTENGGPATIALMMALGILMNVSRPRDGTRRYGR